MSTETSSVDALLAPLPDACKDLRLNLSSILRGTSVDQATTYCTALAVAHFVGATALADAIRADSATLLSDDEAADAQAAAALMGMTTVYYKSRGLLGKADYEQMRPSLRMNRMMSPTSRVKYEAAAFGCAAVAGCESCLKSHEAKLLDTGMTESNIHDLLRISAVVNGTGIALGTLR